MNSERPDSSVVRRKPRGEAEREKPKAAGEPASTKKNAASHEEAALFIFVTGTKRECLSLAGLAATYSPRA